MILAARKTDRRTFHKLLAAIIPLMLLVLSLSANAESEQTDEEATDDNHICLNKPSGRYIRPTTDSDCRDVVRCHANEDGTFRMEAIRCPAGLSFDIEKQTCDWKGNVKNCGVTGWEQAGSQASDNK
ncbi:chitin binding peritrophin-A domain-containing protein [Lysobacter sp. CA196]|uniref:chitin binding peritrophin-A domain-containing protein n=1 Tax=Lysobacter sp. CA196 TaxID=3455606 RepID=UPI003F8D3EB0